MAGPLCGNLAQQPHVSAVKGILDTRNSSIGTQNHSGLFPQPIARKNGFTLLELILALLLIALLVGMVFATAKSSLQLGNNVVTTQNEEMLHQAFFDLLENRFSALPGNTRLELKSTDSASHYLADLTLQNVPLSFTWGGEDRTAKAIQLSTVKRRSGFLDIVLRYYENEIIEEDAVSDPATPAATPTATATPPAKPKAKPILDEEPFAEIILLTDVRYFEWEVIDGRTMEPGKYDWDFPGRLPLQLVLNCAFGANGENIRQVFWIPSRQNPEVFMRQLQQSQSKEPEQGIVPGITVPPIGLPENIPDNILDSIPEGGIPEGIIPEGGIPEGIIPEGGIPEGVLQRSFQRGASGNQNLPPGVIPPIQ